MSDEKQVVEVGIATERSGRPSTEVEVQPSQATIALLGLVVDLTKPSEVAEALAAVRDAKRQLDIVRGDLEAMLVEESQRQGTKTLHLGKVTATVSGGPEVVWDVEQLREELAGLGLPEERLDKLITAKVEYRVNAAVAKQVAAANEAYAAAVESAKTWVEKPFRVRVE